MKKETIYTPTEMVRSFLPEDERSFDTYEAGPKKDVVLMGTTGFTEFLKSIRDRIATLKVIAGKLKKKIETFTKRLTGGNYNAEQAACKLVEAEHDLKETKKSINKLKKFLEKVKKRWAELEDRVIGHVVWAPPISVSTTPHGYTKDICVVKLNKEKFSSNFMGNVLDLGVY